MGDGGDGWSRASRAFAGRLRSVALLAAALGAISAAAGVVLEGAEAAGVSGFSALKETIVRETLETKFGTIWGLAALAWVAFGLLVPLALPPPGAAVVPAQARLPPGPAAGLHRPGAGALGPRQHPVPGPSQLPGQRRPRHRDGRLAGRPGGAALRRPAGTRELEPGDRGRLLAAALSRFSQVALVAVGAILLTGLIQAYVYVRHLDNLVETGYGRAVLIKFCLLMVLIGIGAYNRRRSVPRLNRIAAGGRRPAAPGCCCAGRCAPRWRCWSS